MGLSGKRQSRERKEKEVRKTGTITVSGQWSREGPEGGCRLCAILHFCPTFQERVSYREVSLPRTGPDQGCQCSARDKDSFAQGPFPLLRMPSRILTTSWHTVGAPSGSAEHDECSTGDWPGRFCLGQLGTGKEYGQQWHGKKRAVVRGLTRASFQGTGWTTRPGFSEYSRGCQDPGHLPWAPYLPAPASGPSQRR